jgi:hypothetical protein
VTISQIIANPHIRRYTPRDASSPTSPLVMFLAQVDSSIPYVEYGVGLLATAIVLLIVCWPVKRKDE